MTAPQFGKPVYDLPLPSRSIFEDYWREVGAYAKGQPGVWHPVIDPPVSISRLSGIGTLLKNRDDLIRIPTGIRQPGYSSRIRGGVFFIRYDAPVQRRVG